MEAKPSVIENIYILYIHILLNPPVCHKNKTKPKVAKTTTYICTGAVESRNICMESLKREQNKSHMPSHHEQYWTVVSVGRLSKGTVLCILLEK